MIRIDNRKRERKIVFVSWIALTVVLLLAMTHWAYSDSETWVEKIARLLVESGLLLWTYPIFGLLCFIPSLFLGALVLGTPFWLEWRSGDR